jgi:hypothetical protein
VQLFEPLSIRAGKVLLSSSFPYSGAFLLESARTLLEHTETEWSSTLDELAA